MSPSKRVPRARREITLRVLRQQLSVENASVREQLALLTRARRELLAEIADASGFRLFHLNQVLAAIDREVARGRALTQQLVEPRSRHAFQLGLDLVEKSIAHVGIGAPPGLADISNTLVSSAIEVTNDQLRGVWTELGAKLKATVRRTVLGIEDPAQAVQAIARVIKDPKTFGTPQNRAEAIIRTEVNRTFSLATQQRMTQSNKRIGGGLKKYWLNAGDSRVRDSHVDAGEEYAPGGATGPIPVENAYIVGGASLMFPRDPRGPAEETINCRCVSVPYVEELAALRAA